MVTSATLRNIRISPRKVRLVADLLRGKAVEEAVTILTHLPKGSAASLLTLLKSAVANAKTKGKENPAHLRISAITVDMAPRLKRFMPHAQGRATTILKHASHITLTLDTHTPKASAVKKSVTKPTEKKDTKHAEPPKTSSPSPKPAA